MKALLVLLFLTLKPASGSKRSRQNGRATVSLLPSEPSTILKGLAPRSAVPQYAVVISRFAENLSSWVDTLGSNGAEQGADIVSNANRLITLTYIRKLFLTNNGTL